MLLLLSPVGTATFATRLDVAARLGRDLTEAEGGQVDFVLEAVAGLIREAADKDADWVPAVAPSLLKTLSIEKAIRVIANPHNLASESERLGEHQYAHTFPRSADVGIFLTDAEERRVRRAIYGTNSASARAESIIDDHLDFADDLEINASLEP